MEKGEYSSFLSYRELAHQLVDYVQEMGFTHIELLPICEHPLTDPGAIKLLVISLPPAVLENQRILCILSTIATKMELV